VNSGTGLAATYRTRGNLAVQFQTSGSGQATPFSISDNATGMVQNLNANMVGGLTAQQLFSNYSPVSSTSSQNNQGLGKTTSATVSCPSGTNVIHYSGQVNQSSNNNNGEAVLQGVSPNSNNNGATATAVVVGPSNNVNNPSTANYSVTVNAICASI
jgi:hypothetical protein